MRYWATATVCGKKKKVQNNLQYPYAVRYRVYEEDDVDTIKTGRGEHGSNTRTVFVRHNWEHNMVLCMTDIKAFVAELVTASDF